MRPPSVAVCSLVHLSDRPRWILDFHSLDVSWPLVRCQRLPPPVDLLLCAPLRLPPLPIVAVYVHRRRRSLGTASLSCRAAPRLAAPHLVATLVMTTSPATRATAPCELVLVGHRTFASPSSPSSYLAHSHTAGMLSPLPKLRQLHLHRPFSPMTRVFRCSFCVSSILRKQHSTLQRGMLHTAAEGGTATEGFLLLYIRTAHAHVHVHVHVCRLYFINTTTWSSAPSTRPPPWRDRRAAALCWR